MVVSLLAVLLSNGCLSGPSHAQLLYLDNEDRRERECLMQYQMSGPGDQPLSDPDREVDEAYDMHNMVGMQRQEEMDEDFEEIQRMLASYVVKSDTTVLSCDKQQTNRKVQGLRHRRK